VAGSRLLDRRRDHALPEPPHRGGLHDPRPGARRRPRRGDDAVKVDADEGADALRATVAKDDGASRLGEIALVDKEGRIGPLRTVFYETLLDENAASHIALGNAYTFPVEDEADRERVNKSGIHVDFMIGSNELDVDGITSDGDRVPVLRGGSWQI
jgi:aminopeptidase